MRLKITYIAVLISVFGMSQNKELLYDFNDLPQTLHQNPGALVAFDKHFGIPLLSQFHLNVGSSGVSAYDIFKNDGIDINTKIRNAIFSLSNRDYFTFNQQLEIINGGWRKDETTYFSYGMYEEADVIFYFPKELAVLLWDGNADYIGQSFSLNDVNFKGEVISVLHFGINKQLNKKLTIGARAKLYSSIANVNSRNNSGTFTTRESTTGDNIYEHVFQSLDGKVQTSGLASLLGDDNSDFSEDIKTLRKRVLFGGNLGLGFDVGFTYQPKEQHVITGSLLDVGAVFHSKDVETYHLNGSYTTEGLELVFPPLLDEDGTTPYWQNLEDEFEESIQIDTLKNKYVSWRSTKFNASYRYNFGKKNDEDCDCYAGRKPYQNGIGLQLFSIFRPRQPQFAVTAFYYRRLFDFLRLKFTYTVDDFSYHNIGLGASMHIGSFNMYLMGNNLSELQNISRAQSVSLQFGINLIFDSNE
ncbi:DUF5723 family protein [Psychroserpens luteolus]|uniref:DUF5723 family protein n=1 Tax=Psychroserpens luteolus TaxID=2855840 RepID=UPI001E4F96C1|nr:DUF5723 family protein [Psychroserpens luteolus]MCD2260494.1 hypothetical protein [Psychroserpens luteolus]